MVAAVNKKVQVRLPLVQNPFEETRGRGGGWDGMGWEEFIPMEKASDERKTGPVA